MGTNEKEKEQVYQFIGGKGGGSRRRNCTIKGNEAENEKGEEFVIKV